MQRGAQQGELRGELRLVLRQLEALLGQLSAKTRRQLAKLRLEQVEALGEVLVKFKSEKDLTAWLKQHASVR